VVLEGEAAERCAGWARLSHVFRVPCPVFRETQPRELAKLFSILSAAFLRPQIVNGAP